MRSNLKCVRCQTPVHRVRFEHFGGRCIECNRDRVGITLVATSSGFKNNGACLTTLDEHKSHMQTQHVRG